MKPLFFGIFCALFLAVFSFTLTNIMAIYIASDLGGNSDIASYSISFYGLGNAIGIPLGKPLSERIGIAKLFPASMALFALLSMFCALSPNFLILVSFRFLQGFTAGPFYFMIQSTLNRFVPKKSKHTISAIIITLFTVVPVLGACWGGWIAYDYIWKRAFLVDFPLILLLAVFLWIQLKKVDLSLDKTPFDKIGYFFFFIGLFSIGFTIICGQEFDWQRSPRILAAEWIGISSFGFFLLWSCNHPYPILELHLLKKWSFCYALLNFAFLFSAYFGMIILLALWLNLYANYTPIWIGVLIGTMAVAGVFPTVLIKKFAHIDPRIPLGIAICFFLVSCFYTTIFSVDIDFRRIIFSRVLAGFGLAFFIPPIFRLCFNSFPEEKSTSVMSLLQVVRTISCSLGIAIYTTVWQRRQVFFHERLGEQLSVVSMETQQFFINAKQFQLRGKAARDQLNDFLNRQATALALDDCFYLMGWILTGLLVLLLLTFLLQKLRIRVTPVNCLEKEAI